MGDGQPCSFITGRRKGWGARVQASSVLLVVRWDLCGTGRVPAAKGYWSCQVSSLLSTRFKHSSFPLGAHLQGDFAASSQLVLSFNTCALRRKQWTGKIQGKYLIDNTLRAAGEEGGGRLPHRTVGRAVQYSREWVLGRR